MQQVLHYYVAFCTYTVGYVHYFLRRVMFRLKIENNFLMTIMIKVIVILGLFTLRIKCEIISTSDCSHEIPTNKYLLISLHDLFAGIFVE